MSRVLADWGPPGEIPGDHGPIVKTQIEDWDVRPGGPSRPPNGRGGLDLWDRFAYGGCIGGGPTRPKARKRTRKP